MEGDLIGIFALLVGLELILGVDNVLVIAILVSRLPESQRGFARNLGLGLAMGMRVLMVIGGVMLVEAEDPILFLVEWTEILHQTPINEETLKSEFVWASPKGVALILGGLFLIWKAVNEIYSTVELEDHNPSGAATATFSYIVTQIVMLDLVFSLDSVITAVGLTTETWVIITAVIVSFAVILVFAKRIGDFIMSHVSIKILALAFLIVIGVTIFIEGMGKHVDKKLIYVPMGFAMLVQLLQMRYQRNKSKLRYPVQ